MARITQGVPDDRLVIDPAMTPILEAVDINVAKWGEGVERYGSRTCRVVAHEPVPG